MINIDQYAYISALRRKDPLQKVFFALLTLGVCIWADSTVISVTVLAIMWGITVFTGRIPSRVFARLLLIPMLFLVVGVLTVPVNVSQNRDEFLFSFSLYGIYVGVSGTGIINAARLFFKALGASSCLYYLSLNTPMVSLLSALSRLKLPKLLIELMGLVYRFIFVLLETANTIFTAQNSRLGYSSLSSGHHSLASLATTLFMRAYKRSEELYTALESRGYDGELKVIEEKYETGWTEYIAAVLINFLLILTLVLSRRLTGGLP